MDPTSPEWNQQTNSMIGHFLSPEELARQLVQQDLQMQREELAHQRALADQLRKPQQAHGPLGAVAATLRGMQATKKEQSGEDLYRKMLAQDLAQRGAAAQYGLQGDAQQQADANAPAMSAPVPMADDSAAQPAPTAQAQVPDGQMPPDDLALQQAQADQLRKPNPVGQFMPLTDFSGG